MEAVTSLCPAFIMELIGKPATRAVVVLVKVPEDRVETTDVLQVEEVVSMVQETGKYAVIIYFIGQPFQITYNGALLTKCYMPLIYAR